MPSAKISVVGIYRDEETLEPVPYFQKLVNNIDQRLVLVVDPMLATGGSASAALDAVKAAGVTNIVMICIVTCPEGVAVGEQAVGGTVIGKAPVVAVGPAGTTVVLDVHDRDVGVSVRNRERGNRAVVEDALIHNRGTGLGRGQGQRRSRNDQQAGHGEDEDFVHFLHGCVSFVEMNRLIIVFAVCMIHYTKRHLLFGAVLTALLLHQYGTFPDLVAA